MRSPQLAGFLQYVVEKTLAGDEAAIKAYSIAVDVFGRPHSFDPQTDPIVRVQARRLRTLLDQYYAETGGTAGVRIVLPVGRYVPIFESRANSTAPGTGRDESTAPTVPPHPLQRPGLTRRGAFVAGAAVAILIVLLTAVVVTACGTSYHAALVGNPEPLPWAREVVRLDAGQLFTDRPVDIVGELGPQARRLAARAFAMRSRLSLRPACEVRCLRPPAKWHG